MSDIFSEQKASSKKEFTAAQRAAIGYSGKNLLLSAGAGSGKTATLTEKVCRMVCDAEGGADISRMIIVTFTKLAAKELRDRIGAAINAKLQEEPDNRFLTQQLISLESAQISTIDSFFYKIIKPYFSFLGLPPFFRIADETTGKMLREKIMEEVIDDFFSDGSEGFIHLANSLSGSRDEKSLTSVILDIDEKLSQKGFGAEKLVSWGNMLSSGDTEEFFNCPHGKVLMNTTKKFAAHCLSLFSDIEASFPSNPDVAEKYATSVSAAIEFSKLLYDATDKGYSATRAALDSFSLPALGRIKEKTAFSVYVSETKSDMTKKVKDLKKFYSEDSAVISEVRVRTSDICLSLAELISEFRERYESEKKERGYVDFADLSHYARKIFCAPDGTPTAAAAQFANDYDYIFIDEYQDTNSVQDEIFAAISENMKLRFMVGDIKQSIYAFRGGEPSVFSGYRETFENMTEDGLADVEHGSDTREMCIFMSENFRSDKNIITFANCVSAYMFKDSQTPFEKGDNLICKKKKEEGAPDFPIEMYLIEKPDKETAPENEEESDTSDNDNSSASSNPEADFVAERITSLLRFEKRADSSAIRPKDIAILVRNNVSVASYANALAKRGIPVKDTCARDFFAQSEILLVFCILNAIDNPLRDIYLTGAMKSPVFKFSMDDLLKLKTGKAHTKLWFCTLEYASSGGDVTLKNKCIAFIDFIEKFREKSRSASAAEILRSLYDTLSLNMLAGTSDVGSASSVRQNLTALYEYARKFEEERFGGLFGFITYISELMEEKSHTVMTASDADAVSVMTIHKSKGLEFPICFICETATNFSGKGHEGSVLFDVECGLSMKLRDEGALVLCDTPLRGVTIEKMKVDSVNENMRLLYVALTRAVERLIITAKTVNSEKELLRASHKARLTTPYEREHFTKFSSILLPAAMQVVHNYPECAKITVVNGESPRSEYNAPAPETAAEKEETDMRETIRERLSFKYPSDHLANIPAKMTVSKLRPSLLDEEEITLSLDGTRFLDEQTEKKDKVKESKRPIPRFAKGKVQAAGADIGTATHVFMQFCDFKSLLTDGFDPELERLVRNGFITDEMASLVSREQINSFAHSDLLASVISSKELRREFRFNVSLPASLFTSDKALSKRLDESGTDIIAQGVIDLVFTDKDGKLILVDYKTDKLTEYELKNRSAAEKKLVERHKTQLTYYACACEKMFERPVDSVVVFSLPLGDTVKII